MSLRRTGLGLLGISLSANLADGIRVAAFAILAARYATSAIDVAAIASVAALPHVLIALPLGVLLDRVNRVVILRVANLARTAAYAALAVLVASDSVGSIVPLGIAAFIIGVFEEAYDAASVVVIPDLTEPNNYLRANALVRWGQELGNGALGPFIGSLLAGWAMWSAFAMNSVLMIVSVGLLYGLPLFRDAARARYVSSGNRSERTAGPGQLRRELAEGFRVAGGARSVRGVLTVFGLWNLFGWLPEGVFILFVLDVMGADEGTYGLLLALTSVGTLVGGAGPFLLRQGVPLPVVGSLGLVGYGLTLLLPGLLPVLPIVVAAVFAQGLPQVLLNSVLSSHLQIAVPAGVLGRVYSILGLIGSATMIGGLMLGGLVGDLLGVQWTFVLGGSGVILSGALAFLLLRHDEHPAEVAA